MLRSSLVLVVLALLTGCGDSNPAADPSAAAGPAAGSAKTNSPTPDPTTAAATTLCKVNGEDWAYTKASGIVDKNRKTGVRTVMLTFSNKFKKPSQTIQLRYDYESKQLVSVLAHLARADQTGGLKSTTYVVDRTRLEKMPGTALSGSFDSSAAPLASGTAAFVMQAQYDVEHLSEGDVQLNVTDVQFSGVDVLDLN